MESDVNKSNSLMRSRKVNNAIENMEINSRITSSFSRVNCNYIFKHFTVRYNCFERKQKMLMDSA